MNESFRKRINSFKHSNKEFEKEVILLFNDMLDEEERIRNEYEKTHPKELGFQKGLDGGPASDLKKMRQAHFKKFKELKKEYNIIDVKAP